MKSINKLDENRQMKIITLDKAMELSEGYFTSRNSLLNLICRGKLKRYGPPKRAEVDYYELMQYLGRPA